MNRQSLHRTAGDFQTHRPTVEQADDLIDGEPGRGLIGEAARLYAWMAHVPPTPLLDEAEAAKDPDLRYAAVVYKDSGQRPDFTALVSRPDEDDRAIARGPGGHLLTWALWWAHAQGTFVALRKTASLLGARCRQDGAMQTDHEDDLNATRVVDASGFDEVAEAYRGLDVTLLPLESSGGEIGLRAISSGSYSLLRQPVGSAFHAEGAASEGRLSLILVARNDGGARYNGEALPAGSVVLYGPGACHTGAGDGERELLSLSLPAAEFQSSFSALAQRSPPDLQGRRYRLQLEPSALRLLERRLRAPLARRGAGRDALHAGRELREATVPEVLALVADALAAPDPARHTERAGRSLFHDARDLIHTRYAEPLRLVDLCSGLGVGAESLRLAFQKFAHTSPMRYLKAVRLMRCHEQLRAPDSDLVKTVALRCGFRELGRFAAAYRQLYGRLPREDLRLP